MTTNLAELGEGIFARITDVGAEGPIGRRLMEMGVVPGVSVRVVKSAPFGDPIEIRLPGYSLAMRRAEARTVVVEV